MGVLAPVVVSALWAWEAGAGNLESYWEVVSKGSVIKDPGRMCSRAKAVGSLPSSLREKHGE